MQKYIKCKKKDKKKGSDLKLIIDKEVLRNFDLELIGENKKGEIITFFYRKKGGRK